MATSLEMAIVSKSSPYRYDSFDEDCKIAYQLTRESPVDLFMDHCNCEVVRYDHKEGLMKGNWSHCYEWGEIKNNQELWDWIEKNESKLEIKITF